MATKKDNRSFEECLGELETLVKQLEAGGMPLSDTIKAYEQGEKLAERLKKDLEVAQERLSVLKAGKEQA